MFNAISGKEAKMVQYIIPTVASSIRLDRRCPHCSRPHGRIHCRRRLRPISDTRLTGVAQQRLRCPWCGLTWTVRADGVGAGRHRSDRLRTLGVILYMLGLSYRAVAQFLPCLDCRGSKSSIERDVADAGAQARSLHEAAPPMRVRVLGVDGTGAAMTGCNAGMLFYVDTEGDRLLYCGPDRLVRRYSRCRKGLGWKINQLLQHVERTWESVSDDPRDPTNNVAERQIGLTYKIRSKTMRGFKSPAKALAHPYLASLLRGRDGQADLSKLF